MWILEYSISADVPEKPAGEKGGSFPELYGKFKENNVFLYEPKSLYLTYDSHVLIKIAVPSAISVAVIMGKSVEQLSRSGDVFQGDITVRADTVFVCGNFSGREGDYDVLLHYLVKQ